MPTCRVFRTLKGSFNCATRVPLRFSQRSIPDGAPSTSSIGRDDDDPSTRVPPVLAVSLGVPMLEFLVGLLKDSYKGFPKP